MARAQNARMRADRLVSLLLLLQNRGRLTAPELAAELEVSVRTVYRDVEALAASGVPVVAERGPLGGYRLLNGYRTRLTGLNEAEAGALPLAALPGQAQDLGLGPVLASARRKVGAALPDAAAERMRLVGERFHLDAPGWFREADPAGHLAAIARAVWEQRVVRARYRRWRGEVRRELCPLGIVLKGGLWYLVAASGERADGPVRTYRITRLAEAEVTGARFARPEGFGLAEYWARSAERLAAAVRRETAVVRVSPRAVRLLPMLFGAAGSEAVASAGEPDAAGWVEVRLPVEAEAVAVGDLLRLGAEAEVLAPAGLRAAMARTVAELAGRYRE